MTYCLCFAIILLNTDLHNKNMKENSRMTLDDFIRFNRSYGEMNKGHLLPVSLLTDIYNSIAEEQLLIVDDVVFPTISNIAFK